MCDGYTPVTQGRSICSQIGSRANLGAIPCGEMAEWSMAVVLKTTEPETVPGVRIPLSPPSALRSRLPTVS